MKKLIGIIFTVLIICTTVVFAGSIPEDLLGYDEALVFFGEIVSINTDDTITVLPTQKIKGDVEIGTAQTFEKGAVTLGRFSPKKGEQFLMGYYDENNPLYLLKTTSTDPRTLEITAKTGGGTEERMQKYLNNGDFEQAEIKRLAKLEQTPDSTIVPINALDVQNKENNNIYIYIGVIVSILAFLALFIVFISKKRGLQSKKSDLVAIILSIIAIVISFVAIILSLTGRTAPKNLANMTSYSTEGTGAINVIEWEGAQYHMFGIGVDHLIGEQIGIVDGDKNYRVYVAKGYSKYSWIIEKYHAGEMDAAVLWKKKGVENIPVELEHYKLSLDARTETARRMIENDGREIAVNSGADWSFTLNEEKLVRITNKVKEYTGVAINNDFGQYDGYAIDVNTYDTMSTPYETYLFVFSGNELIFNIKFITAEHFDFVKNLCNDIVQN